MHMAELLGIESTPKSLLLSEKQPSKEIRTFLRGENQRVSSNEVFKKSTPPGRGSNLINVSSASDWFMQNYTFSVTDNLLLATVGSYSEDGLASSCYHNNLSILENILSHTQDEGSVVVDMVAGTDAFASTLYAQFDALIFVAEPTRRGLAVLSDYLRLAEAGGVADRVMVVANKVDSDDDRVFVQDVVRDRFIGSISRSGHLAEVDKGRASLSVDNMSQDDRVVFENIAKRSEDLVVPSQQRLEKLWRIHEVYVGQGYIKNRFGDLRSQIDTEFRYDG
jgi:CO dehydrogenase maturation factor